MNKDSRRGGKERTGRRDILALPTAWRVHVMLLRLMRACIVGLRTADIMDTAVSVNNDYVYPQFNLSPKSLKTIPTTT